MPDSDSVRYRALKDWLDVDRLVVQAVGGIVDQGMSLTSKRVKAILKASE